MRYLLAIALFVYPVVAMVDNPFCTQVNIMHQYCSRPDNNPNGMVRGRTGKAGPRGAPGPPGKTSTVDYDTIYEMIEKKFEEYNAKLAVLNPPKGGQSDGDEITRELKGDLKFLQLKVQQLENILSDWHKGGNGYFYKLFQNKVNYETAKAKCEENGAILASVGPRDTTINKELVELIKPGETDVWIGLNDIKQEGKWVWEDGNVNGKDADWLAQRPNGKTVENCGHYWKGKGWKVNDYPCDKLIYFLCEKTLKNDWYRAKNGFLYKLFQIKVSYETARAKCEENGAVLASAGPRDMTVNKELVELVKPGRTDVWIGLNDIKQEGRWVWEDGSTNGDDADWLAQRPNGKRVENCGHYWRNKAWKVNDYPCDKLIYFLCEKEY